MQQTENYKLNLIETSDPFSPEALNENARKLETELARVDGALDGKGNCRFMTGTYTGNDVYGSASKATVLQLERYPDILFVFGSSRCALFFKGITQALVCATIGTYAMTVKWGEDGALSWYVSGTGAAVQLNASNTTYTYIGLYTA